MLVRKKRLEVNPYINIFRPMERNYYGANAVAHLLRTMRHIDY